MKKKIPYLEFLPILIIGLVLFKLVDRIDDIGKLFVYCLGILEPLFWAIGIAYVLNPMMKFFQKKLRLHRIIAILLCYIIVIGIVSALVTIVSPLIYDNIYDLISNLTVYQKDIQSYFNEHIVTMDWYRDFGIEEFLNFEAISKVFTNAPDLLTSAADNVKVFATGLVSGTFKIVVGLIIAVYLLMDKEKFQKGLKRTIYGYLNQEKADKFISFSGEVNKIFSRYIIGKTIDSAIIGVMCYFGLLLIDAPYAPLLAIIVGITNMIPYFGPFIGMVPAFFLTLFVSPLKAFWVLLFIFGLQQFDGYILGPKILGESVGLSPFWIILGILVGGSLLGVLGMLLAVPIVAVMQLLFRRAIDKRLENKNIVFDES